MKIILYIIFIFLIIRFIRALMNTQVIIRKFDSSDMDQQKQSYRKKEGEITVIEPGSKSKSRSDNGSGDYVDYEEIK